MSVVWVICGAARGVGKTRLARCLCELLPRSVRAKQGHGRRRPDKCPNLFRTARQVREFIEACRGRHDHVVVESNALARQGAGDVVIYLAAAPGSRNVRPDAEALRAAAHVRVEAGASRAEWRRSLAACGVAARLRAGVCKLLVEQAAFRAGASSARRPRPGGLAARTKVWLVAGERHVFGEGLADLLEAVARRGSLRKAAEARGMSYRHAWQRVRLAEARLGRPLIARRAGGAGGGGSQLTDEGRRLLALFRRLSGDVDDFAARRLAELPEQA